jgi:YbgC/YbaW family acyl-CoA thioester hydrolase
MFDTSYTVEWGDCDEAGIVFYPNYFYWFDCTFHKWLRSLGCGHRELKSRFRAITPLVEVGANFIAPVSYDVELRVHARLAEVKDRRFRIAYEVRDAKAVVAEGFERRAWAVVEDGRMKGRELPAEFVKLLS